MNKADVFLNKYREIENLASSEYHFDDNGSQMSRLERLPRFKSLAQEIRCCREVRNLLSHNPKIDGQYIVEPNDSMTLLLDKIIGMIKNPPLCRDIMLPLERVLCASERDGIISTMQKMAEYDISKVPVLSQGRVTGVFSSRVLFRVLLDEDSHVQPRSSEARISDLGELISIDGSESPYYGYTSPSCQAGEIEERFDSSYGRQIRMRMFFVTDNGKKDGCLRGIITPWELIDGK